MLEGVCNNAGLEAGVLVGVCNNAIGPRWVYREYRAGGFLVVIGEWFPGGLLVVIGEWLASGDW